MHAACRCDGECTGGFEPLTCTGGKLGGGCRAAGLCDDQCGFGVHSKAICRPPEISVEITNAIDSRAAGKLVLVLEDRLGTVVALEARLEAVIGYVGGFAWSQDPIELPGLKDACVPLVLAALGSAVASAEVATSSTIDLVGSIY